MGVVSGGGSGGSQPSVPIAASSGTIDTTTYDNPVTGSGKIATLVFPANTAAFAIALEGDAFPRWCFAADPVNDDLTIGDGTFAPDGGDGAFMGIALQSDGTAAMQIGGAGGGLSLGHITGDGRTVNQTLRAVQLGNAASISSGGFDPNLGLEGAVGDIFIRTDSGVAMEVIYRCTVAGGPGVATWAGIV